jgi:hypothetical protein
LEEREVEDEEDEEEGGLPHSGRRRFRKPSALAAPCEVAAALRTLAVASINSSSSTSFRSLPLTSSRSPKKAITQPSTFGGFTQIPRT